jgi:DNA-binding NtrC family response regulator
MSPIILLVDDDEGIRFGFTKFLTKAGYDVTAVSTLAEAKKEVLARRYDAVLLDLILPDGNGIDWIEPLRENFPHIALVVISGVGDIPLAVEAMSRGADNFLTKPVNMKNLDVFLKKSLELETLRKSVSARKRMEKPFEPYFGESEAMKKIRELVSVAAENDSSVLLEGETGTGKGVLARWIHDHSLERESSFIELNCSSLRGELLASELFGHAKGAFTSAVKEKQGLLQVADGGTLFLDEIGDMDITVQAQFLKVIEEKRYRRLGEVKERRSEFRLICSTNRELQHEAREKRFRNDLFFRINVFPIIIPPLRKRKEDIPGLIMYLIKIMGATEDAVSKEAMDLLVSYPWPGNIREVRNVLERAFLLSGGTRLSREHLPGLGTRQVKRASSGRQGMELGHVEASHIASVLRRYEGDTEAAAKALGISRASLYRRMKKFGLNSDS